MIINKTVRQGDSLSAVIEAVGMLMTAINRRVGTAIEITSDYTVQNTDELIVVPATATGAVSIILPLCGNTSLPRWIANDSAYTVSVYSNGSLVTAMASGYRKYIWPTTTSWIVLV